MNIKEWIRKELNVERPWSYLRGIYDRLDKQEKRIIELENKINVYEKVLKILNDKNQ